LTVTSARLGQLTEQLDLLRRHLLPEKFDPTGLYDRQDEVSTMALAYRVLAHAEIESYFEDQAWEVVREARSAWERGHVSRVALCLMAFSGKTMDLPPATLQPPTENKRKAWPALVDVGEKLVPLTTNFHNFVRNGNHGVKEKNLLSLLLPIGVDCNRIDPTFLAAMESFGALRGIAAHSSVKSSTTKGIDPEEELKRVRALLPGIQVIDAELERLRSTVVA
jgi:hypothetical protein